MDDYQDDYGYDNAVLDTGIETDGNGGDGYIDVGDGEYATFGDGALAPDGDYGVNADGSWE